MGRLDDVGLEGTQPAAGGAASPVTSDSPRTQVSFADGSAQTVPVAATVQMNVAAGTTLGRYVVTAPLGAGAMATVYAAHDPKIDRTVAVKLLHQDAAHDPDLGARLAREAQALARVDHPNVVRIYDVGAHADQVFIAMELVPGHTLRHWLSEHPRPVTAIVSMFLAAARGLAAAHAAGLVHRDFKPENVLVGKDGRVKVSDFGLASTSVVSSEPATSHTADEEAHSITRTGAILGTPVYMAPEQISGGVIDARSDQFSFCVALYEALYGTRPFSGRSMSELSEQIRSGLRSVPPVKTVPVWLRRILERGLTVDPAGRFPSMTALIAKLDRRPIHTRRLAITATLGLAAAVAGIAIGSWARGGGSDSALVCSGADTEVATAWAPARKLSMQLAFLRTGRSYAEDAFERAAAQLDHYAGSWKAARKDTCEATRVRKTQSEAVLDLRMSCMNDRLRDLRAVVSSLAQANEVQVRESLAAVAALEPVAQCTDVTRLQITAPRPADPIARARIDGLTDSLATLEADRSMATATRVARARELVTAAKAVGYDPIQARALLDAGRALGDADLRAEADASLREAIWVADRGRDDRTRALASLELLRRVAKDSTPTKEGPLVLRQAEAAVSRLEQDDRARAELAQTHATYLIATGHAREAVPLLRESLELIERDAGPDSLARADATLNLAVALAEAHDPAAVLEQYDRALAVYVRALGPRHPRVMEVRSELSVELLEQAKYPDVVALLVPTVAGLEDAYGPDHSQVANARRRLGVAYRKIGNFDAAQRELERALTIHKKVLGPAHPEVSVTLDHLGRLAMDRKDFLTAVARFREGIGVAETALGPAHLQVGVLHSSLGTAYRRQGQLDSAIAAFQKSLAITEAAAGPQSAAMSEVLTNLGGTYALAGNYSLAVSDLERALALRKGSSADPLESIAIQMTLATVLWDSKIDRPRALVLVNEARGLFAARGNQNMVKAVDDQLAHWRSKPLRGERRSPPRK